MIFMAREKIKKEKSNPKVNLVPGKYSRKEVNKAVLLMIICTVFTSLAQLFLKSGVARINWSLLGIITNWVLVLGVIFYGLGALIMLFALKQGELSLLYPFLSLSYVWVPILSIFFLGEKLVLMQWLGIALIIIGASIIRRGASHA